jgi:hypothetical protein
MCVAHHPAGWADREEQAGAGLLLLCWNEYERICDRVDRKRDSILYSDFTHQFCYVRFDRALADPEGSADFLVGSARDQHFQNLFFAARKTHPAGREYTSG